MGNKTANKRLKMLSVRVSEEELGRVKKVTALVKKQNKFVEEADVIRELIGLENSGIITPQMRLGLLPPDARAEDITSKADDEGDR
jgi:hypothetical protein